MNSDTVAWREAQGKGDRVDTGEQRWLSDEQQDDWLAFVVATRLFWSQLERDLQREAGIPLTYYEILSVLSESRSGAMRMSAIARTLQLSPSRLSQAVSRLEESGWVRRELCPSDRRAWLAVITADGRATIERLAPAHVASVRRHLIDSLSPAQLHELGNISRTLLTHLAPGLDMSRSVHSGAGDRGLTDDEIQRLPTVDE